MENRIKQIYQAIQRLYCLQMRAGNLHPALKWITQNRDNLEKTSGAKATSVFEYKMHQLCCLEILEQEGISSHLLMSKVGLDCDCLKVIALDNIPQQVGSWRRVFQGRYTFRYQMIEQWKQLIELLLAVDVCLSIYFFTPAASCS